MSKLAALGPVLSSMGGKAAAGQGLSAAAAAAASGDKKRYLDFLDMIDGGGMGQSGPEFEGAPVSDFLNMIGVEPYKRPEQPPPTVTATAPAAKRPPEKRPKEPPVTTGAQMPPLISESPIPALPLADGGFLPLPMLNPTVTRPRRDPRTGLQM